MKSIDNIFAAYFNSEGWHAIYKKYGAATLARENYRWKRIMMKRFGPNRKMSMRIEMQRPREDFLLGRIKKYEWKGGTIEVPFSGRK